MGSSKKKKSPGLAKAIREAESTKIGRSTRANPPGVGPDVDEEGDASDDSE